MTSLSSDRGDVAEKEKQLLEMTKWQWETALKIREKLVYTLKEICQLLGWMYIHQLSEECWKRKNCQEAQEKATFNNSYEKETTAVGKKI